MTQSEHLIAEHTIASVIKVLQADLTLLYLLSCDSNLRGICQLVG